MSTPTFSSVGPKGGDVEGAQATEARRAALNPLSGVGLHRFEDKAVLGVHDEKPWHNLAAYMVADGRSSTEIAEAANVTPGYIAILKAQRWFQERVSQISMDRGKGLAARMQAEADASLDKIIALRDGAENERVALSAATLILEQVNGKATQKVLSVNANTSFSSESAEHAKLMEELAALRKARGAE